MGQVVIEPVIDHGKFEPGRHHQTVLQVTGRVLDEQRMYLVTRLLVCGIVALPVPECLTENELSDFSGL
ncbi:hypothetical protein [Komagataeibacter rhaeticus]|uniref:hypothetical protein n=1 Tax=Komagataeibacter rhaeticus TaxID=215221 RepID=UPI00296E400C|nr:hypothetical protein [Komagataeibacter rhaeticus]